MAEYEKKVWAAMEEKLYCQGDDFIMETITFDIDPALTKEAEVERILTKEAENPYNNSSINEREQQKEKALAALVKVQTALKGAAEKAGFKNEEELQRYAKDVVRQEIWEERYAKSYA